MRRALLVLLLLGCSGTLEGELVEGPVADWSFVGDAESVQFATAGGQRFRAVAVDAFPHDGGLYLHVMTFLTWDDAALEEIADGGGLRMQTGGKVYALEATPLTRAAEIEAILPTLVRDRMQIEARGIRWDPESARYPGTQLRQWFFRLRSAEG